MIFQEIKKSGTVTSGRLVQRLGISRQAAAKHLRALARGKKLMKIGSTRLARYVPYNAKIVSKARIQDSFSAAYGLKGLEEDAVFREIELKTGLSRTLSRQAYKIAAYAFTEMLNNAIDHSKGKRASVRVNCGEENFVFEIGDKGIGAFESVRRKFGLGDAFQAVEHLLKGKQSADPKHHSGQGIFFTSKIADEFILESAKLRLIVDNRVEDVFLEDISNAKGTRVKFTLRRRTRKDLKRLFDAFSDSDYEFDKTRIMVHLSEREGEHVSRSQARRLLFGLDGFKRIVLDFKKVKGIGQGFADEIFRVYQCGRPRVQIEPVNASSAVRFMIERALNENSVVEMRKARGTIAKRLKNL